MPIRHIFSRLSDRGALRVGAVTILLGALLVLITVLIINVRGRLTLMERAETDNGQWVMIQTEVEVLRLSNAIGAARGGFATETEIRRWFDVLYSRVDLLSNSPLYARFMTQPTNAARLAQLRAYIAQWQLVIDDGDSALLSVLPQMDAATVEIQTTARNLSLAALVDFSTETDQTRAGLSETLILLGIATGAMIALLGLLALMLTRVSRHARREANENQITGARLQMIIATSPDAIVVTNRGGWVVEFNPAAEAMFGISRSDILGHVATSMIFAPEDRAVYEDVISDAIGKAVSLGPQRLEIEGLRADGSRFPLEISLAIRDLSRGALIVAFARDISARRASNAALQDALSKAREGEQTKARFIAVMSHEMRTPLNGVLGSMDLLRETRLDANQSELLRVMQVSGEILLGHVNSVLDVSMAEAKVSRPSVETFDFDQLIDDCLAGQIGVARAVGTTFAHVALTGAFGPVRGDAGQVRQILLNLIGNAVKFTPQGTITLETERLPPEPGAISSDWAEIRVIDTGIGIAPEDQDRVFEDFEMADASPGRAAGGTGLGLGIARRLVEAMGGQIGVESELGAGSLFWVRLPLPDATRIASNPPQESVRSGMSIVAQAAAPLSVLIIEDNDINRFLLRRYLETAGHDVAEAVNGADGVAQASDRAFDLIITDIAMPHLNGIEAARAIRARGASAKARIIALTAQALPDELARLPDAGIDACLTKPVTRAQLVTLVEGIFIPDTETYVGAPGHHLDPELIAEMRAALEPSVAKRLIEQMIAEGDTSVARLASAGALGIPEARLVHHLAGACATFGCTTLRLALVALEAAVRSGDADALIEAAALPGLWSQTRAALIYEVQRSVV